MEQKEIINILEDNIMDYSSAVNRARAIPDAKTGLKPIHRKILYEMYADKILSNTKFKKCAYMVGQIISRFSEHGDSATYEALVRMSQPWIQRYPLIEFHGNAGSQFGDPAASMRYTEARLSKIAEQGMLETLKKDTVDWRPNFTYEEEEPVTLPSLFPGLFCLPNQGIGYAVASNFLTYNLKEVVDMIIKYINTGELDTIYYDLASGGVFINPDIMKQIYATGKGSVIIEGKYEVKGNKIIFTELPFGVMLDNLVEEIAKFCDNGEIPNVRRVYNGSGSGKLKLVIELEKDADSEYILNKLFLKTHLRNSYGVNQVALVNNTPKLLTQKEMVDIYIEHNLDCILRELNFDYKKLKARIEILEGLLKALEDIENIIKLIKNSSTADEAKTNLISKYNFTENQAKAILDMKLSKLANLEKIEINKEYKNKIKEAGRLEDLIKSEDERKKLLILRLTGFISKYKDDRRTVVEAKEIKKEVKSIKAKEKIIKKEDCYVILTEGNFIKRLPTTSIRIQHRNTVGMKTPNDISKCIIKTDTLDDLILFTNKGKAYAIKVNNIPQETKINSMGISLNSLIKLQEGERPISLMSVKNEKEAKYLLFVTKLGYIKKTPIESYIFNGGARVKTGTTLTEEDALVAVDVIVDEDILVITEKGRCLRFNSDEVPSFSKNAKGVRSIRFVEENDYIRDAFVIKGPDYKLALFFENGNGKKLKITEFICQSRNLVGIKILPKGMVFAGCVMVKDSDRIFLTGTNSSLCIESYSVPESSKISLGHVMIKNSGIISVCKI